MGVKALVSKGDRPPSRPSVAPRASSDTWAHLDLAPGRWEPCRRAWPLPTPRSRPAGLREASSPSAEKQKLRAAKGLARLPLGGHQLSDAHWVFAHVISFTPPNSSTRAMVRRNLSRMACLARGGSPRKRQTEGVSPGREVSRAVVPATRFSLFLGCLGPAWHPASSTSPTTHTSGPQKAPRVGADGPRVALPFAADCPVRGSVDPREPPSPSGNFAQSPSCKRGSLDAFYPLLEETERSQS